MYIHIYMYIYIYIYIYIYTVIDQVSLMGIENKSFQVGTSPDCPLNQFRIGYSFQPWTLNQSCTVCEILFLFSRCEAPRVGYLM